MLGIVTEECIRDLNDAFAFTCADGDRRCKEKERDERRMHQDLYKPDRVKCTAAGKVSQDGRWRTISVLCDTRVRVSVAKQTTPDVPAARESQDFRLTDVARGQSIMIVPGEVGNKILSRGPGAVSKRALPQITHDAEAHSRVVTTRCVERR